MITIGAQWDGGDYYSIEYVNNLYRSCLRNINIPFEFLLYAGPLAAEAGRLRGLHPDIRVWFSGLPYWWGGMRFWMKEPPGVNTKTLLYLDIDQVIVGCLDELILYPSDHACMKDWPKDICPAGSEKAVNVGVTLLKVGSRPEVWEAYEAAGMPVYNPIGAKGNRPLPMAAQGIINDGVKVDLFPEGWCQSYKLHYLRKGLSDDCRIVAFHGRPKPHEVSDKFVKENWK